MNTSAVERPICAVEPLAGRHFTWPTPTRSGKQFALILRRLANAYPNARSIHLVLDNLSTHSCRSLLRQKVGHSTMLLAIAAGKRKNDRVDARKIADLLRCDYFPECHMAEPEIRDRRWVLRFRNLLVRQAVRMETKMSGLLMETGVVYNKQKLHTKQY